MKKVLFAFALMVLAPLGAQAGGPQRVLTFRSGIGVGPVLSGIGTAATATDVNRNIVRDIQPSGFPWMIRELRADVSDTGMIDVRGKGLLVAGGDGIGTNANQKVFVTLACGAASPFTTHSSTATGVALDPEGDFRITEALVPPPPAPCVKPALLIRNLGGAWFAVGIAEPRHPGS